MNEMFSERARRYLASLERRAHVDDMVLVRDILLRHGVPPKDAFLEFHAALAGYVEPAGDEEFVYGIVHPQSHWYASLAPSAHETGGTWFIIYADGHPSFEREMDEHGVLYHGRVARAASFQMFIEQHAYIWDYWQTGPTQRESVRAPAAGVAERVRAQMEPFRVSDLCDRFSTVWANEHFRMLADTGSTWLLWKRPGVELSELTQIGVVP